MTDNSMLDELLGAKPRPSSQPTPKPQTISREEAKSEFEKWKQCCEDKEYEKGVPHLLKAAEGDYPPALNDVAFQYFKGRLLPDDIEKAEDAARRGADQSAGQRKSDNPAAAFFLGWVRFSAPRGSTGKP